MRFEQKHPEANPAQRFPSEYSFVVRNPRLGACRRCARMTRWVDVLFQVNVCSDECNHDLWEAYREEQERRGTFPDFKAHFECARQEMAAAEQAPRATKDILIVVYNQLPYVKECLESVVENTTDYMIHLWDNGCNKETRAYLREQSFKWLDAKIPFKLYGSPVNQGFVTPNNWMAEQCESDYIVLLNSDCKVFPLWDQALTAQMNSFREVGAVGYWGGHLGPDGRGFGGSSGWEIDYIPGWCLCLRRTDYEKFGLFDPKYEFAYCEDADFSMRLKAAGKKIYALHAPLVFHHQNKTICEVEREGEIDVRASFEANHERFRTKWSDYLAHGRVLARGKESHELVPSALVPPAAG